MNEIYRIETSQDGHNWLHQGGFSEGQASRFGVPFDANVAAKELVSFINHRGDRFRHVRLIIEIQPVAEKDFHNVKCPACKQHRTVRDKEYQDHKNLLSPLNQEFRDEIPCKGCVSILKKHIGIQRN